MNQSSQSPFLSARNDLARLEKTAALGQMRASSDFDLNGDEHRFGIQSYAPAAVLIPLIERGGALHTILTKRTADLRHHPGQVAFPGGKMDAGDPSKTVTALREAQEEIGLDPGLVRIIGEIGEHRTITGFNVTPVLGHVTQHFTPMPETGEVDQVFEVPLEFLMDPKNQRIDGRIWQGQLRRYYVIPYGPFYIWGATARIIAGLRDLWWKAQ